MSPFPERRHFVRLLRERGHRVTPERLTLLEAVFDHHGHLSAEELLDSMKARGLGISRATVYRNLELLVDCGLVRKHRLGSRYLYEHVHPGLDHDHLVCTECGRIAEFMGAGIQALLSEVCRAHGFEPDKHQLQIFAVCRDCAKSVAPRGASAS